MKLEERNALVRAEIELEVQAEYASRRTSGILSAGWSHNTVKAFSRAARILRKRLEEGD